MTKRIPALIVLVVILMGCDQAPDQSAAQALRDRFDVQTLVVPQPTGNLPPSLLICVRDPSGIKLDQVRSELSEFDDGHRPTNLDYIAHNSDWRILEVKSLTSQQLVRSKQLDFLRDCSMDAQKGDALALLQSSY